LCRNDSLRNLRQDGYRTTTAAGACDKPSKRNYQTEAGGIHGP
jgi:hypothetical protein